MSGVGSRDSEPAGSLTLFVRGTGPCSAPPVSGPCEVVLECTFKSAEIESESVRVFESEWGLDASAGASSDPCGVRVRV